MVIICTCSTSFLNPSPEVGLHSHLIWYSYFLGFGFPFPLPHKDSIVSCAKLNGRLKTNQTLYLIDRKGESVYAPGKLWRILNYTFTTGWKTTAYFAYITICIVSIPSFRKALVFNSWRQKTEINLYVIRVRRRNLSCAQIGHQIANTPTGITVSRAWLDSGVSKFIVIRVLTALPSGLPAPAFNANDTIMISIVGRCEWSEVGFT